MAIAGSAVPSVELYMKDGKLVVSAVMLRNKAVVIDEPAVAVEKIKKGEKVFLRLLGLNLHWAMKALGAE
jgi:hypothetical protein